MTDHPGYRVRVTQADIEGAHRSDSYGCVVVRAIARHIPAATNIRVDVDWLRFTLGDRRLSYSTPWRVADYIRDFDRGQPPAPFTFRMDDPRVTARRKLTPAGAVINAAAQRVKRAKTPETRAARQVELDALKAEHTGAVRKQGQREPGERRVVSPGRPRRERTYGARQIPNGSGC